MTEVDTIGSPIESGHLKTSHEKLYRASVFVCRKYLDHRGYEVNGLENLPEGNAPYILAVNHRSMLDIPAVGCAVYVHDGSNIRFVAKKELWNTHEAITRGVEKKTAKYLGSAASAYLGQKLGGWTGDRVADYFDATDGIKYDRDKGPNEQPEVMRQMHEVLQNNGILGMFPEHTRRKGRQIQIEKRGLGMLAVANFTPILPVGVAGTEERQGPIVVQFGERVEVGPVPMGDRRGIVSRMKAVESEYTEALQAALDEAHERRDFLMAA